jgi:nucleotide-binding universal stress UspA family protein
MIAPSILVPLDGTEHALCALPVAKTFADLHGGTLHIVHVADRKLPPRALVEMLGLNLAELKGSVLDARSGRPAQGIVRAALDPRATYIVMCTHTAVPRPVGPLGSTAEGVLRDAPCPVVLVRPERGLIPWSLRRVLFPHDGTPTTGAAMGPAMELARRVDAELVVLHVAAPGAAPPLERGSLTVPRYLDQPQHEWPSWAEEFVGRLACGCPVERGRLRMVLTRGQLGEEIIRFASGQESDLIVLAWRGEWEKERAATLKAVVRAAPCPVMVLRVAA